MPAVDPAAAAAPRSPERGESIRFTVAATGDVLTHPGVLAAATRAGGTAFDFAPLLRDVGARVRRADLGLCHQELVVGTGRPHQQGWRYLAPPELAEATAALGWDACSVASNHAVDHGEWGIASTIAALEAAGLEHTGTFLTRRASRRPLIVGVRGVELALLSYTEATNHIVPPAPFSVGRYDASAILADACRARRRGADAVVVNLHDGGDFEPRGRHQQGLARRLAASPAITAIVGQGPHIVRPIRFVGGKPVVFSEGDLLSDYDSRPVGGARSEWASGLIAELVFVASRAAVRVTTVRYLPLHVDPLALSVAPIGRALRRPGADREALHAEYREVVGVAGRSPRIKPVPRRLPPTRAGLAEAR
jgi:poly-gamma-glutamate capsule biosynthesis protein CapA/YwtB (metallophosphatase superfamily)